MGEENKLSVASCQLSVEKKRVLAPSPPYSGERVGVRGSSFKNRPSPRPSPLSTGERERCRTDTSIDCHLPSRLGVRLAQDFFRRLADGGVAAVIGAAGVGGHLPDH